GRLRVRRLSCRSRRSDRQDRPQRNVRRLSLRPRRRARMGAVAGARAEDARRRAADRRHRCLSVGLPPGPAPPRGARAGPERCRSAGSGQPRRAARRAARLRGEGRAAHGRCRADATRRSLPRKRRALRSGPRRADLRPAHARGQAERSAWCAAVDRDRVAIRERFRRIAPFFKPAFILFLFAVSLRVLQDTLAHYRYHDVVDYFHRLSWDQILLAVGLTLAGYLVMTGYDTMAMRYIRHPLPYAKIAMASC